MGIWKDFAGAGHTWMTKLSGVMTKVAGIDAAGNFSASIQSERDAWAGKPSYYTDGTTGGYVWLPPANGVPFIGNMPMTVICIFKNKASKPSGTATLFTYGGGTTIHKSMRLTFVNNVATLGFIGAGTTTGKTISDQGTHAVVGVYDKTNASLYMDGIFQSQVAYNSANFEAGGIAVGIDNTGSATTGMAGEFMRFMVFNYALSAEKIARYSAGAQLDYEDTGAADLSIGKTWTTGGHAYETFTPSGKNITSAINTTGFGQVVLPLGSVTAGVTYRVCYTLTLNSGTAPNIALLSTNFLVDESNAVQLVNGTNYADLVCTTSDPTSTLQAVVGNGVATNFALTIVSVTKLGAVIDFEPEGISSSHWRSFQNTYHGVVGSACKPSNVGISARQIMGDTSGTAVPAGIPGETIKQTFNTTVPNANDKTMTSVLLKKGRWGISGAVFPNPTSNAGELTRLIIACVSLTNNVYTNTYSSANWAHIANDGSIGTGVNSWSVYTPRVLINETIIDISVDDTPVYIVSNSTWSAYTTAQNSGWIQAVRIA